MPSPTWPAVDINAQGLDSNRALSIFTLGVAVNTNSILARKFSSKLLAGRAAEIRCRSHEAEPMAHGHGLYLGL